MVDAVAYDSDAQHRRDVALAAVLDISLSGWEAWLATPGSLEACPEGIQPYAVDLISGLRALATGDPAAAGRGRPLYLQALAQADTSALAWYAANVPAHKKQ